MKHILLFILFAMAATVSAAPFVVTDPTTETTVTHCAWYLDSQPRQLVAAPKDSSGNPYCKIDMSGTAKGSHTIAAAFVIQDTIWGEQEGPKSVPLAFERPGAPSTAPSMLILVP